MRQTPPGPLEAAGRFGSGEPGSASRLQQIVEVQRAVAVADLDLDGVMTLICERTQAITGADGAAVLLPEGDKFRFGAATGYIQNQVGTFLTMKSLSGWAFLNNEPALSNDTLQDPRVHVRAVRTQDMRSLIAVPMRHGGEAIGLLQVSSTRTDAFCEDDVQTLDLLSVVLSAAVSHASEFEALNRFRTVFDGSPFGLARLGPDATIAEANAAFARMLGYAPGELVGKRMAEISHPEDLNESRLRFASMRRGETDSYALEKRYLRTDGSTIWCRVTVTALERDGDGKPAFAIVAIEDVTERKLAELALWEHNERLGRIVETQTEVTTADLDIDASMQLIVERAQGLTDATYGTIDLIEGDELVTRAVAGPASKLRGYRRPFATTAAAQVLASGQAVLAEHVSDGPRLTRPLAEALGDGSFILVPLRHAGQPVGTLSVSTPEGCRRLTEDDLRTAELLGVMAAAAVSRARESQAKRAQLEAMQRFEAAWSMSAIGMELISLDGHVVAANPAMDDVYGYSLEEYASMYVTDFTHPEDVTEVTRRFFDLIKGRYESDICTVEARFFHKEGRLLWVRGSMSLVRDADGKPQFVLGMAEDFTEQKQTELALRESEERQARIAQTQADVAALGLDVDAAMALVASRSQLLTGVDCVAIGLIEDDELRFVAASGSAIIEPGTRMPLARTITGDAIESGHPVLVTDPSDERLYRPITDMLGLTSVASVPLSRGGKPVGAIIAASTDLERPVTSSDIRGLDLLAVVLSSAMSSAAELEAERRQAEAREQAETIYRHSPLGIGLVGVDGRMIEANEALEQLTGRAVEELTSLQVSDLAHPDDHADLADSLDRMLAGELDSFQLDARYLHADGSVVWAATTMTLLREVDGVGRVVISMWEDITERKLAELALAESNERSSGIAETQAEVVAVGVDVARATELVAERSYALTCAADTAVTMVEGDDMVAYALGGDSAISVGTRFPLANAPVTREAMETGRTVVLGDTRANPTLAGFENVASFAAAPLYSGGKPVGVLAATTRPGQEPLGDADARTLELLAIVLSAALSRASELQVLARLETIHRHAPMGIGISDLDGRIREANEQMVEILGYSAEELATTPIVEYGDPAKMDEMVRLFKETLKGKRDTYEIEVHHTRKDGTLVWINAASSMVRNGNGEPLFSVVMVQDVTERKLAERALQEKTERLARIVETQGEVAAVGGALEKVIGLLAARARELTGADASIVNLVEGDDLVARSATGVASDIVDYRRPLADTPVSQRALAEGRAVLIEHIGGEPDDMWPGLAESVDNGSTVCVPLYQGSRPVGTFSVLNAGSSRRLGEEDRQTMELLGVMLSSAISSAAEVEALTRFETVYKGAPIGIGVIDLEGRLVQANQQMCDISGYTPAELAVMSIGDYAHPDDRERLVQSYIELLRGTHDSVAIDARIIRVDGRVVWTSASTSLVRDAEGKPLFAIAMAQDVTQQKDTELALQEKTARLSRIVDTQAQVAAAGLDLEGVMRLVAERSHSLTRGQGALIDLLDGDELVTRAAIGAAAGTLANRRPARESLDALVDGQSLLISYAEDDPRLYRPIADELAVRSLVCVPLFRSGRPVGALTVVGTDEDERLTEDDRQTLELLGVVLSSAISRSAEYEALSRFETIYQGAPIGIGLLDLNGVMVDANAAMLAISGRPLSERRPIFDFAHPDDIEEISASFRRLVRGEIDSYRNDARHFRPNGSVVWVDASVTLLRDSGGHPRFALTMAQDITERRAAEEQLRQSQKIEAIGQLSAGIAHDFNNLLMGMLGYAGLARGEVEVDSRVAEYLDRIEKTAHRAAALTKQLLAFGRRQTLQPRTLDLNDLISETLSMLERVLGEQVEIVARLDPGVPTLRADPTQLQQVLFNLALNARDAMPQGGMLTMETTTVVVGEEGLPGVTLAPGRHVLLSVSDTGVGMTPEVLGHIFEPFFTTKGVGEGTGLGLPSVYGIVKQSHGDIDVTSVPGSGTAFRIYLPSAEQPAPSALAAGTAPATRARVLVVEDARVVRDLIKTLLEEHGYEPVIADDAAHAVRLAQEEPPFDVLLTDLVLARGSGADLAARVQEHQPHVRVLYMSAYEPDQRIDREALIPKPFRNDELLEKLASMLTSEAGV